MPTFRRIAAIAAALIASAVAAATPLDTAAITGATPLDTAINLRLGKYSEWSYGSNHNDLEIDCTQFIVAVVEKHLSMSLNPAIRDAINIAGLPELEGRSETNASRILGELVLAEDPRTTGVVAAMEKLGEGSRVSLKDLRPGDITQYWIKGSNGWFGHAAVVERIRTSSDGTRKMKLYGAHKSIDGVGSSLDSNDIVIRHNDTDRKIYAVRLNR